MSVPFEALDVHLKREIKLDISHIFNKVVCNNRGGYCYELNYLFHSLLSRLGFDSSMISARIFNNDTCGPEFDHMAVVVNLTKPWLVDVGYGDLFIEPIQIKPNLIQKDLFRNYRVELLSENKFVLSDSIKDKTEFIQKYIFELKAREIGDFLEQNIYKQSSPKSYFVNNFICTIPTQFGRKTILNQSFKLKEGDQINVKEIIDNDSLKQLLIDQFDIEY